MPVLRFELDGRATLERALGAVADPAALWPQLLGVFLAGVGFPARAEVAGHEDDFVTGAFARFLDRAPSPYERWALVRAPPEDAATTPRALVLGGPSRAGYRRRSNGT